MDGFLIQDVLLTLAGNRIRSGRSVEGFWPAASIFVFTRSCSFVDAKGALLVPDPNAWLDKIARRSRGLWLHCVERKADDWLVSGFANQGARWIVETTGESCSELWEASEHIDERGDKDRRDWVSVYKRIDSQWCKPLPPLRPLAEVAADVRAATAQVMVFARENGDTTFEGLYRNALQVLDHGAPPERNKIDESLLAELSPQARRLYAGADAAWQFGGMGSWNDQSFEGAQNERYETITSHLYRTLCAAIAAAVNSTFPAR